MESSKGSQQKKADESQWIKSAASGEEWSKRPHRGGGKVWRGGGRGRGRGFARLEGTSSSHAPYGVEEFTPGPHYLPSSRVTPHLATQPQLAQHSALTVHSGTTSNQGGTIMFYSSVQKRGGAFTASEDETRRQLQHRQRRQDGNGNTRKEGSSFVEAADLYSSSKAKEAEAKTREVLQPLTKQTRKENKKRNRFDVSDDEDMSDLAVD